MCVCVGVDVGVRVSGCGCGYVPVCMHVRVCARVCLRRECACVFLTHSLYLSLSKKTSFPISFIFWKLLKSGLILARQQIMVEGQQELFFTFFFFADICHKPFFPYLGHFYQFLGPSADEPTPGLCFFKTSKLPMKVNSDVNILQCFSILTEH